MVKTDFETFIFSYCSMVKPKAFIKYLGTGITTSITGVGITILVAKYYQTIAMRVLDSALEKVFVFLLNNRLPRYCR